MHDNLFELFGRTEWLLHRYHQHNHRTRGPMGDPHRGQGRILAMLKLQPEISQRELSYLLDIRPQSLGELLAKLERSGYIIRTTSEDDRRIRNIQLTPAGAKAAEQQAQPDELFAFMNQEEQKTLAGLLLRLIEALEQQLDDDQPEEWEECDSPHPHTGPHGAQEHPRHPGPGRFPHDRRAPHPPMPHWSGEHPQPPRFDCEMPEDSLFGQSPEDEMRGEWDPGQHPVPPHEALFRRQENPSPSTPEREETGKTAQDGLNQDPEHSEKI